MYLKSNLYFFITVHLANKLVFVLKHFLGSRGMVRSAIMIDYLREVGCVITVTP